MLFHVQSIWFHFAAIIIELMHNRMRNRSISFQFIEKFASNSPFDCVWARARFAKYPKKYGRTLWPTVSVNTLIDVSMSLCWIINSNVCRSFRSERVSEWVSVFTFKAERKNLLTHSTWRVSLLLFFRLKLLCLLRHLCVDSLQSYDKKKNKTTTKRFHFEAMKHQHTIA